MSTKRRVRRQRATITVYANDLLVEDENGEEYAHREGEWVKFIKKVPMRLIRVGRQFQTFVEAEDISLEEFDDILGEVVDLLAPLIADWNWTNQDVEPDADDKLPLLDKPRERPGVFWDLEMEEVMWLLEKQIDQTTAPDPTSSPSSESQRASAE